MQTLFIIALIIDLLAAIYFFRLAFIERSNMNSKYKFRFGMLVLVIFTSVVMRRSNLGIACIIAGLPAASLFLFIAGMAIAMASHKGPWH